jgi:nitrite reductase (NO-forming)
MLSTFRNVLAATASAAVLGLALVASPAAADEAVSIVRAPTDLPGPLEARDAETVDLHLTTIEKTARLADGTTYRYWTFNGGVPGPFLRVRVGDTVNVTLTNDEDSWMPHNIDFHSVTGPHGGGELTMVEPGETRGFTFKALKPGLYVYHCATPMVAHHIAAGMYGMILVEPEGGLPEVDREFYVMQGEIYTEDAFGMGGEQYDSIEKLVDERPEYYVFNGAVGALTEEAPLTAEVGETIRIYFGVGGPNKTSSFHMIGEIFDKVYQLGSFIETPISDVQTVSVPPGGAVAVDVTLEVPGTYALVDHALSRMERGLVAHLVVEGEENPEIFGPLPNEQISMLP